jgi:outer membrane protein assembly factor BamB
VIRGTTICCSVLALISLIKPPEPVPLVPLRPVWTLALNSYLIEPPAYDQAHGYFAIEGDRVAAYDVVSGTRLWLIEARPLLALVAADDLVYIVETNALTALGAADGSVAWRASLTDTFATRPGAGGGWLVGVTRKGSVTAFRAADGHVVWQREMESPPHGPPTIASGRVYLPTADGRVVAMDLESGAPIWERKVGGLPDEILALGGRIFVGSTDTFLYCLLARDGRLDWRWRTGGDIVGAPVADARSVYFVSLDNVLRALNPVSGGQQWIKALPFRATSAPQLAGGTVVVSGQSPAIKTFSAKDGAPGVDIAAGEDVAAPPRVLQDPATGLPMLVVVTRNITKGDSVTLSIRSMEPPAIPMAPLPNPVMPPALPAPTSPS